MKPRRRGVRLAVVSLLLLSGCDRSPSDPGEGSNGPSGDPPTGPPPPQARLITPPDHPYFMERWYLLNLGQTIGSTIQGSVHADVRALEAWEVSRGNGVTVGVLDTGVSPHHPNLQGRLVPGWDFIDDGPDTDDVRAKSITEDVAEIFHGTAVADAVLAIAPGARIMPLRVIGQGIQDRDLADAVRFARDNGVTILNMSLASFVPGFGFPLTRQAIAESPGVLVVAGAGNSAGNSDIVRPEPCTIPLPNVLCVAATNEHDELATTFATGGGSNWGPQTVHLAAPGANFFVAQPSIRVVHLEDFSTELEWEPAFDEGPWAITTQDGHSHSRSLEYVRGPGLAGPRTAAVRMTEPVSLQGERGCWLDLRYWSDLSGGYLLALESSANGTQFVMRVGAQGFTLSSGTNGEWRHAFVNLDFEVDRGNEAYFGFRVVDQGGAAGGRVRIDDLRVTCNTDSHDSPYGGYGFADGTSFSVPLVAGAAALLKAAHPQLSPAELKLALMAGGARLPSLQGRTVLGTRLDAAGALRFAALYRSPPAPLPVASVLARGSDVAPGYRVHRVPLRTVPADRARATGKLIDFLKAWFDERGSPPDPGPGPERPPTANQTIFQNVVIQIISVHPTINLQLENGNPDPAIDVIRRMLDDFMRDVDEKLEAARREASSEVVFVDVWVSCGQDCVATVAPQPAPGTGGGGGGGGGGAGGGRVVVVPDTCPRDLLGRLVELAEDEDLEEFYGCLFTEATITGRETVDLDRSCPFGSFCWDRHYR